MKKGLDQTLCDPEAILALFAPTKGEFAALMGREEQLREDLAAIERKMAAFDKRIETLLDLVEGGDINREQFRERKERLDKERVGLQRLKGEVVGRLAAAVHTGVSREQAEAIADFWRLSISKLDTPATAPKETSDTTQYIVDDNIYKGALSKLNVQVIVEGKDAYLRGTFTDAFLGEDGSLNRKGHGDTIYGLAKSNTSSSPFSAPFAIALPQIPFTRKKRKEMVAEAEAEAEAEAKAA